VWLLLAGVVEQSSARLGSFAAAQEAGKPVVNYRNPPREYQDFKASGWEVKIEKQMLTEDPMLAKKALARLEQKLSFLLTILPKHTIAELQTVTIFMMYGSRATGGGQDSGMTYHHTNAPDRFPELDLRWRNCAVIHSAQNYVNQSETRSAKAVLHELSHSWHLMHWPQDMPEIVAAWKNATDQGLYRNVTDNDDGKHYDRAYALTNASEYFAELSCMFFFTCNYPPLNRRELKLYDPIGYAMIETAWGVAGESESGAAETKKPKRDTTRVKPKLQKTPSASGTTSGPAASAPKEYRTWTDTLDKSEVEAQFAGMVGGNARLRKKDGTVITVPVERLSKDDQDWIRDRRR
jgi:hypothetical protein